MRVIDDGYDSVVRLHRLESPRHALGVREAIDDRVGPYTEGTRCARRGERVLDVELPTERKDDVAPTEPEPRERQSDFQVARVVKRVRDRRDLALCNQSPSVFIVSIDDREAGTLGCEQLRLCGKVRLHRLVEVEVILRQVREHGDVELDSIDPMLRERVRRHLHRAGDRSLFVQVEKRPLQLRGLGRRPRATEGADDARRPPFDFQDVAQKLRRRRLAVGTGDPDHPQLSRRVVVERARGERHRLARHPRSDDELGGGADLWSQGVFADESDGTAPVRLRGEIMAVYVLADETAEQRPWRDAAMVECHLGNADALRLTDHRQRLDALDDLLDRHTGWFIHHGQARHFEPPRRNVEAKVVEAAGGAMSKRLSAYCMIFEKTGADTDPP